MAPEDLIEDGELVITMSRAGYIKAVPASTYRTQGRGTRGMRGTNLREADIVAKVIHTTAHAHLLFFSNLGRVYRLRAYEVPLQERTARGSAIVNLLPLGPGERIQALIDTREFHSDRYLVFATKQGQVKKTAFAEYDRSRRDGLIALNLREGDELVSVIVTTGQDDIFMVSRAGMTIRFSETDVRAMGRDAAGVRGMAMRAGDEVVAADIARDETSILMVTSAGYGKRTQLHHFNPQGRGGFGVRGIRLTSKRGGVVSAFTVGLDDEILVISSSGVVVRLAAREIFEPGPRRNWCQGGERRPRSGGCFCGPGPRCRGRLMADPIPRQPGRPITGRQPPTGAGRPAGPPPAGWGQPQPGMPRYGGPPGGGSYYPPGQSGPPPGRTTRGRPGPPTQAVGLQRPRPPAGPMAPAGAAPPARRAPYGPPVPVEGNGRLQDARVAARRQVVRRVSVWSVFKVSLIFYILVLAVFLITGVAIWNVASDFGVINSLDKLVRSLFALSSFKIHPLSALAWGSAAGAALCFLGVLINVISALLYNLISDVVGGIRVTLTADREV